MVHTKIFSLLFFLTFINVFSFGQDINKMAKPIVDEGTELYQREIASWYGTDIFLQKYSNHNNIGGYFSYNKKKHSICIFYSNDKKPKVIGTITFKIGNYSMNSAKFDLAPREFNKLEKSLYTLRKITLQEIEKDTIFKRYSKTNLNLIPIIYKGKKKVYILTGPQESNVVIFGNDYLLTFDSRNRITGKKVIHNNIIPVEYSNKGKDVPVTIHTHTTETGSYITATDICTLLLYGHFTGWKQHIVATDKYLNMWNIKDKKLTVVTKDFFDKVSNFQKNKNKTYNSDFSNPNLRWLHKNGIKLKNLDKINPNELVFSCDSTLLRIRHVGDTLIMWTLGRTSVLDTSKIKSIIKKDNYSKTFYINGINYQGNIEVNYLKENKYYSSNDSLFELVVFSTLSPDSLATLRKKMYSFFDAHDMASAKKINNLIHENEYKKYKLIFHPNIFSNGVFKGNSKNDIIQIKTAWKVGNKKYYRIDIKNFLPDGTPTKYSYLIDENYKFMEYEGCNKKELEKLTKNNQITVP